MKNLKVFLIPVLLVLMADIAHAQTAVEIIRKMEDQMRGESSYVEMKMSIVRPRYTRDISMKTWSKGEDFSLILITDPARDRGTAYLKRHREIWNWVPSIDRMVKLPPSMMSQNWMGSDFTNDDLVRESSTINDFTHRVLRSETVNGHETWVLELIPKPESAVVFGKILIWVTKGHYLQIRAENYDESGILVSKMEASNIKQMGGRNIPSRIELITVDKNGHKTVIEYQKAEFNIRLNDDFFSVQNLKQVR